MAEKKLSLDGFEVEKFKPPKKKGPKGPKLKTWLVWITFFVLGVGFLAFGNVKFYTKQRVRKVDSVPVWTHVETETVIDHGFRSDSNNLQSTGGFLNYHDAGMYGSALDYYNTELNYYGDVTLGDAYSYYLRINFLFGDNNNYFQGFAPVNSNIDRSASFFNYYIEKGSNVNVFVRTWNNTGLTSFDLTPGVVHSVPYSDIDQPPARYGTNFELVLEKIDRNNEDPDDNLFRLYPSVDLTFYDSNSHSTYNFSSYENFGNYEEVIKKTEMVLEYREKVTYYDEFKFNLNGAQFNEVATGLFDKVTDYIGGFLGVFNVVFEFLQFIFGFIIDTLGGLLGKIIGFFS